MDYNKLELSGFIGTINKQGTISRSVGKDNQGVQFVIGVGYDQQVPSSDLPKSLKGRQMKERKIDWFNCTSWDEDIVQAFEKDYFGKGDRIAANGYIRFRKGEEGKVFTNVTITSLVRTKDLPRGLELNEAFAEV